MLSGIYFAFSHPVHLYNSSTFHFRSPPLRENWVPAQMFCVHSWTFGSWHPVQSCHLQQSLKWGSRKVEAAYLHGKNPTDVYSTLPRLVSPGGQQRRTLKGYHHIAFLEHSLTCETVP